MNKRALQIGLIAIVIIMAVAVGLLYFLDVDGLRAGPPPSARIVQPTDGLAIRSGEALVILVEAEGPDGIARVDLSVNDVVVGSHNPSVPSNPFLVTPFYWFSSHVGEHRLEVIAYDHQGQASDPAYLIVAVHARGQTQGNGQPDNLPPGSDIDMIAQDLPNAAEAVDGDRVGGDENGGQADQVQPAALGDEAPIPAVDNPPDVENFDYELDFDGQDFVAILSARVVDDLGIDVMEFVYSSNAHAQLGYTHDCGGQAVCEIGTRTALSPGEWLLSVQAFDTSGQASEPELLIVEVLGVEDQPPAAAGHDEGWREWFADQFGDIANPEFDFNGDLLRPNWDIAGFLDLFGGQEEDLGSLSGHCIEVSGGRGLNYNRVSFEVRCDDLAAPEGRILYAHISKRVAFQQDGGIALHIQDWYDEERDAFEFGDSLSWDDFDIVCGLSYEYAVRIVLATVVDPGRNSMSALRTGEIVAYAERLIESQPCSQGSLGDVALSAQLDANNDMEISWQLPVDATWPQEPAIENGLHIQLLRYAPFLDEQKVLFDQVMSLDQINNDPNFEISDPETACNTKYWYTLQVISAEADLDLVSPGWIIRRPVEAPSYPCDNARLDEWFNVSTFWYNNAYHNALVEVEVPEGAQFPAGENVEIWLEYYVEGSSQCLAPPCDGNYKIFQTNLVLNGRPRASIYEKFFDMHCGGNEILIRMAIAVDRAGIEYSNTVSVRNEKCSPPTPKILSVYATVNDCPANMDRCVHVQWEAYQQPIDTETYNLADRIVVQRRNLNQVEYAEFSFDVGETMWIDASPLNFNENAAEGFQCEAPVLYRVVAYDQNGRFQGASPIHLSGLTCGGAWDLFVEHR